MRLQRASWREGRRIAVFFFFFSTSSSSSSSRSCSSVEEQEFWRFIPAKKKDVRRCLLIRPYERHSIEIVWCRSPNTRVPRFHLDLPIPSFWAGESLLVGGMRRAFQPLTLVSVTRGRLGCNRSSNRERASRVASEGAGLRGWLGYSSA